MCVSLPINIFEQNIQTFRIRFTQRTLFLLLLSVSVKSKFLILCLNFPWPSSHKERTLKNLIYLYLGIQFGGVLFSTSHAANNFIGTGLFILDTRSRVIFSVIFDSLINLHHPKCGAHKQNKKTIWSYKTPFLFTIIFDQYWSHNYSLTLDGNQLLPSLLL